ncbi:hypothetical protein R1flu_001963 [Riccia fluitans]|uniref:Uncharacterized protein n=1 Tax=Riccia fluitans TaxID=41844 RepID=A0ABD1Y4R3_9MARC
MERTRSVETQNGGRSSTRQTERRTEKRKRLNAKTACNGNTSDETTYSIALAAEGSGETFVVAFYSQNLFQKDVFSAVGWIPSAKKVSAWEEVFRIDRAQALVPLVSTVPGYWVTVTLVDTLGR